MKSGASFKANRVVVSSILKGMFYDNDKVRVG